MRKDILLGIVAGIISHGLLFNMLSDKYWYVDVFIGALVASTVSNSIIPAIVIVMYVIGWKILGLFFLANYYGARETVRYFDSFIIDYLEVFLIGVGGGLIGFLFKKWIGQKTTKF